jgi:cellulose synthase/poly-beta-1,6-N-acetylglucosamine synthase-like glycosyltransferase
LGGRILLISHCSTARYLRLIINAIAHWRYESKPVLSSPIFSSKDVTIILPTVFNNAEELRQPIQSMLACNPFQILLVTTECRYKILQKFSRSMNANRLQLEVKVLKIPVANKRLQVCKALPFVKTRIMVMVDDDVIWPSTILPWLLAPFKDVKMGGVGTCQHVRRLKSGTLMELCYNWLGAAYIERRNFEISATHYMDGGTSCMSGRTCAFRTEILQDPDFLSRFTTEEWRGRLLKADDDNFITRWLVAKGWKTWVQYNRECDIETTLENNPNFLHQCLRWARSNWRSNWTSMVVERHIWR